MKVILLESVAKVGRKYDIVDVAPGYARNFLMPKSLAEAITGSTAGRVAELRRKKDAVEQKAKEAFASSAKGGKGLALSFSVKANEEGHLFASIDRAMIAEEASKALGMDITPEMVELERPIKDLGEKKLTITAHGASLPISVTVAKSE